MEKLRLFLVISLFALLVAACGNDGSNSSNVTPTQPVSVSLSDLSATVEISKTYQFDATVENAEDTSVDWQVNKVSGGSSTMGTISESGLYTAPDRVPSPVTVTVTAVAHADATKEASATVTIMSNVTVAVSPADTTLPAGETLQFTAAIENAQDTAAKWTVNDVPGGDATVGTISAGLYTAPSLPPPGGVVTIAAISLADTSKTDSVSVTVQFSNASVNGPYVFSMSGHAPPMGVFYAAGRFVADGDGNVVNFVQDLRQGGLSQQMSTSGTYTVQPDGRGSLTVTFEGMPVPTVTVFQLTSSGEGPLLQFVSTTVASGQYYKQDSDTFSNASMNGSYVMQMLGAESSGTVAGVGVITIDGAGNLTGMQDVNTGTQLLTKMSLNGTYSVDTNGRAVVTTVAGSDTSETAMYLISSDRGVGVPLNAGSGGGLIWMEKQQITTFSNASISGDYVGFYTGNPSTHPDFALIRFTADGNGTLSAGIHDENNGGTVSLNEPFTGTYSISSADHGRTTVSVPTPAGAVVSIAYLVSEKKVFVIDTSLSSPSGGQIIAQEGAPFSTGSLQGMFVHSLRGIGVNPMLEVGKMGTLALDGSGSLSGAMSVNIGGFLIPYVPLTGTYSVEANGRGQVTLSDGMSEENYILHVVDSSHAYLLYTGSDAALFGSLEAQFPVQVQAGLGTTF